MRCLPSRRWIAYGLWVWILTGGLPAVIGDRIGFTGNVACGDTITLKDGRVLQGHVDYADSTIVIADELRRTIMRRLRVAAVTPDSGNTGQENIGLTQPIKIQNGAMPLISIPISTTPWSGDGRREFRHLTTKGRSEVQETMTQALTIMGPKTSEIRGLDKYWKTPIATSEFPREKILRILGLIDRKKEDERLRVLRFLLQAEWFDEARAEIRSIREDIPTLEEKMQRVLADVVGLQIKQKLRDAELSYKANQPRRGRLILEEIQRDADLDDAALKNEAAAALKIRTAETAADRSLAKQLRDDANMLENEQKAQWSDALIEMLSVLETAPDAVRERFAPYREAAAKPEVSASEKFAIAVSGYLLGPGNVARDAGEARMLWDARTALRTYLSSADAGIRENAYATLTGMTLLDRDRIARLARYGIPPLANADLQPKGAEEHPAVSRARTISIPDADGPDSPRLEYQVWLPPEYHPLRQYPALVALHNGSGPQDAMNTWGEAALQRGMIVIAPEYLLANQPREYRYSPAEHAKVTLILRDARKRFAVDGDRIHLAGSVFGADMAWDYGLSHPDMFAGVSMMSGFPAKYVIAYKRHLKLVSTYITQGYLLPGSEVVVLNMARDMMSRACDITYSDYPARGRETLPAEVPLILDWMLPLKRKTAVEKFEVSTARVSDDRFYGVVIKEWSRDRTPDFSAVDVAGQNLKPATLKYSHNGKSNIFRLETEGLQSLDVWLSPKTTDFTKRVEIYVNKNKVFQNMIPPDIRPLLEDLRIRGDRHDAYWFKAVLGRSNAGAGANNGGPGTNPPER